MLYCKMCAENKPKIVTTVKVADSIDLNYAYSIIVHRKIQAEIISWGVVS